MIVPMSNEIDGGRPDDGADDPGERPDEPEDVPSPDLSNGRGWDIVRMEENDRKRRENRREISSEPPEGLELVSEDDADSPSADLPEWSERDERLLKWFLGPEHDSISNTLFEPSERRDINERLLKLMTDLEEKQKLTTDQLKALKTSFDETREASERLGRKDWLMFGMGAFASLLISAVFSPAAVIHFSMRFIHAVGHLFVEGQAG